ncbi:MAG: transcriptional regulator [Nitrospira bacterium HGW-Nitrospira-1]|nr:MAG: transcriptional regulator [Nitrospira bacterium HGW-Nitrospira-1]
MNASVLIVDDDKLTRETLSRALSEEYAVYTASNGQEALDIIGKGDKIDVVLSDLEMPGLKGLDILERVNALNNSPVVILITGQATIESAVQAMKLGAYDYITKPVNLDRISLLIEKSLENKRLKEENILLRARIRENYPLVNMIGSSPEMGKIMEIIRHVSSTAATALIEGESGTGKELIANIIHYNSPRSDKPFIKVSCAAFAEGVLESEIFGHEKGAFTGAVSSKKGRFELADGGTLFLDEIGDIPLGIQVKLLRFLQEKTFERVGGNKTCQVDVRIISATNKHLERLVSEGSFREDLYYRLRVVKIDVPPLRKRKGDIDDLAGFFLNKYSQIHNRHITGISDEVMAMIRSYDWPGNVRELMNCIESFVVLARGSQVTIDDIPDYLFSQCDVRHADDHEDGVLAEMERQTIMDTMRDTGGNKVEAAKKLGIGLRTLYRKIEKFQL